MKTLVLISLLALGSHANARAANDCKQDVWMSNRNVALREITAILEQMPRESIIHLAWGEMLRADAKTSIALPVLQFLISTEQEKALNGYYKVLALSITDGQDSRELLKTWPVRSPSLKPTTLTALQMCQLYQGAKAPAH